jgi:hypothetical protein
MTERPELFAYFSLRPDEWAGDTAGLSSSAVWGGIIGMERRKEQTFEKKRR